MPPLKRKRTINSPDTKCYGPQSSINEYRYQFSEIVLIKVGSPARTFYVHEGLLKAAGGFFRNGMNYYLEDTKLKTIEFPNDDAKNFEVVLEILYRFAIPSSPRYRRTELLTAIDAWILADRLSMNDVQNSLLEDLRKCIFFDDNEQQYINCGVRGLQHLQKVDKRQAYYDSPLAGFLIELCAHEFLVARSHVIDNSICVEAAEFWRNGGELVARVMVRIAKIGDAWAGNEDSLPFDPAGRDDCTFHVHKTS